MTPSGEGSPSGRGASPSEAFASDAEAASPPATGDAGPISPARVTDAAVGTTAPAADASSPAPRSEARGADARLVAALREDGPGRVVSIGERARAALETAAPSVERGAHFESLDDCARASPLERRAEGALFAPDSLEMLERDLGLACRLFPERLLALFEEPSLPAPERLLAFGFRRLVADGRCALHEYRLRDYKSPPEWLNARFWAHPERFGLGPEEEAPFDEEDDEDEETSLDDTVDD